MDAAREVAVKKTADEWNNDPLSYKRRGNWMVWDPDSWPRHDPDRFGVEWYVQLMTEEEFVAKAMGGSTVGPWIWGEENYASKVKEATEVLVRNKGSKVGKEASLRQVSQKEEVVCKCGARMPRESLDRHVAEECRLGPLTGRLD